MPLVIALMLFAALFCCEAFIYDARRNRRERELIRYDQVEHPARYSGEDRYIDLLA
ncbi:MAG: hypothetical protein J6M47_11650 [Clostridia bacterium]|nr:hypothetical protein [Clostridia bacterium]